MLFWNILFHTTRWKNRYPIFNLNLSVLHTSFLLLILALPWLYIARHYHFYCLSSNVLIINFAKFWQNKHTLSSYITNLIQLYSELNEKFSFFELYVHLVFPVARFKSNEIECFFVRNGKATFVCFTSLVLFKFFFALNNDSFYRI